MPCALTRRAEPVTWIEIELIGESDEPIPEDIREYVAPEDRDRVHDEIVPAVERAGFWDGEIALRHVLTGVGIPVRAIGGGIPPRQRTISRGESS